MMKRLMAVVFAVAVVGATPTAAAAQENPRLDAAKQRATAAIDRRLEAIERVSQRVKSARQVQQAHEDALVSQFEAATTGLEDVRTAIENSSDLASVREHARSIVEDFRVFALLIPKARLVVAADTATAVATRLEAALVRYESKHPDADLDSVLATVRSAKEKASSVPPAVIPLAASGYPANRATLEEARTNLKSAFADLKAARDELRELRSSANSRS